MDAALFAWTGCQQASPWVRLILLPLFVEHSIVRGQEFENGGSHRNGESASRHWTLEGVVICAGVVVYGDTTDNRPGVLRHTRSADFVSAVDRHKDSCPYHGLEADGAVPFVDH